MRNLESRQWASVSTIHTIADTSVPVIPAKTGFRFFITSYIISVSVAAAQAIAIVNSGLTTILFETQGSVLQSHTSPDFFKGIQVADNQGVSTSVGVAGPRFTVMVEGYYEPVNV